MLWDALGREPLVPKAYTIKHGVEALNERPVGTGPWRMVEWKRKDQHALRALATGYWGTAPLVKRMRFQTIPEAPRASPRSAPARWRSIEAVPPIDAAVLARGPGASRSSSAARSSAAGSTSTAGPRTSTTRAARTASSPSRVSVSPSNHAINRDAIIKKIFGGYAIANTRRWRR